jgi:hypothetical protein
VIGFDHHGVASVKVFAHSIGYVSRVGGYAKRYNLSALALKFKSVANGSKAIVGSRECDNAKPLYGGLKSASAIKAETVAQLFILKTSEYLGRVDKHMHRYAMLVRQNTESRDVVVVLVGDEYGIYLVDADSDTFKRRAECLCAFSRIDKDLCAACRNEGAIAL